MKYALTHCYTDHNKGDAAIIIATTQLIRKCDDSATISMFSTFGPNDEKFKKEHEYVGQFSDSIYPGMFYQPQPVISNNDASRLFHFAWITLKFVMLLVSKNERFLSIFFTKYELKGITVFLTSDMIISKGGSYITAQNTSLRQCLSLVTMLYPFLLAKRYKKKMVIFSQSLGPVKGRFNRWLTRFSLSSLSKIYLREDVCLKEYEEISELKEIVPISVIPDSAFYLISKNIKRSSQVQFNKSKLNIGITLVDHAFKYIGSEKVKSEKIATYKKSIVRLINELVNERDVYIHIFPQVIVANSHQGHNDVRISKEIEGIFRDIGLGERVKYHFGDYNPMELRSMYSEMDLFVGTRLHSVIFALSENVPSINIAYHGTKSQGILKSVSGFEDYVISIDEITPELIIEKVNKLIESREILVKMLVVENTRIRSELERSMFEVLELSEC